jgi:hypothetical protein
MVPAMVWSSFLVAGLAFLFVAVILKRAQNPEDLGGVRTSTPVPLPPLPPLGALPEPLAPAPVTSAPSSAPSPGPNPVREHVSVPAAARSSRNNGFSRFAPRRPRTAAEALPR